jgi:hypothetical protein
LTLAKHMKFIGQFRLVTLPVCWTVAISAFLHFGSASAAEKQMFDAEVAELIGGASRVSNGVVSGDYLAGLASSGQGVKFGGLPAASKIAIRYSSTNVGTISVAVDGHSLRRAASCASRMTRAGSTMTIRAPGMPGGIAAAIWDLAISTTTSRQATRPATCGAVRSPAAALR